MIQTSLIDRPILPGVPARANPPYAPDLIRYPDSGYPEWPRDVYMDTYSGLVDLDKPMNDCAYFVRYGKSEYGHYVREGRTSPVLIWQARNDYDLWQVQGFSSWYDAQGWSRDSWWTRRQKKGVPA